MKQTSLGLDLVTRKTRTREFLEEMNRVVPWSELVAVIEPYSPRAQTGRPPFLVETMLRIHILQQWFGLSDTGMEVFDAGPLKGMSTVASALLQHVPLG